MVLGDVVIAALDAKLVRLEQNVRVGVAERRLEAIRGELDQEAERILEVDRVHEAAVFHARVPDAALIEPFHRLREDRLRQRERNVVHATRVGCSARRIVLTALVREHRDQTTVAGIEVEVALGRVVEIRLFEDERHPERALPEVDRRLPLGADDRDVVNTLALDLAHPTRRYPPPL